MATTFTSEKIPAWVAAMCQELKRQNGNGWLVHEVRGMDALPAACYHERCGERLEKTLTRNKVWQQLVAEVAALACGRKHWPRPKPRPATALAIC